jgi:hypothetical protein
LYYRDLNSGSIRNLEKEAQLAKYWSAAAIPMRHFDEEEYVTLNPNIGLIRLNTAKMKLRNSELDLMM